MQFVTNENVWLQLVLYEKKIGRNQLGQTVLSSILNVAQPSLVEISIRLFI
jgi:hypothetical protein